MEEMRKKYFAKCFMLFIRIIDNHNDLTECKNKALSIQRQHYLVVVSHDCTVKCSQQLLLYPSYSFVVLFHHRILHQPRNQK